MPSRPLDDLQIDHQFHPSQQSYPQLRQTQQRLCLERRPRGPTKAQHHPTLEELTKWFEEPILADHFIEEYKGVWDAKT